MFQNRIQFFISRVIKEGLFKKINFILGKGFYFFQRFYLYLHSYLADLITHFEKPYGLGLSENQDANKDPAFIIDKKK
jgi:hypothetical protein